VAQRTAQFSAATVATLELSAELSDSLVNRTRVPNKIRVFERDKRSSEILGIRAERTLVIGEARCLNVVVDAKIMPVLVQLVVLQQPLYLRARIWGIATIALANKDGLLRPHRFFNDMAQTVRADRMIIAAHDTPIPSLLVQANSTFPRWLWWRWWRACAGGDVVDELSEREVDVAFETADGHGR
jgi:hypothetical protein